MIGWALVGIAPLVAQEERPGDPGGERRPGRPAGPPDGGLMKAADTNGDKMVTREEFDALERISKLPEEKRDRLFKRLDRNGDGVIKQDELRMGRGPRPFPPLRQLDKDGDKSISYEEFSAGEFASKMPEERRRKFFDKLDTNGDGKLSPEDRRGRRGPGGDPEQMFRRLDGDKDGTLSFEEFSKGPWSRGMGEDALEDRFEQIDKNGDLKLDPEEMRDAGPPPRGERGKRKSAGPPDGPPPPPPGEDAPPPPNEEME